jgi:sugar/nucleoside kinase (ribokinase family)
MRELDIVGIGNPLVDVIHSDNVITKPGGSIIGTLIHLQKLGLETGVIGRIGDDNYKEQLLEELKNMNIDLSRLRFESYPNTVIQINISKQDREIVSTENYRPIEELSDKDMIYLNQTKSIFVRPRHLPNIKSLNKKIFY